MRRVRPGDMKNALVTFEVEERTSIGGGNWTTEWVVSYASMEAFVEPISGSERFQAQQLENPTDYKVVIPYPETSWQPTESMRIVWQGMVLGIRNIHWSAPRAKFLQIDCEAGISSEQ